MNCLHCGEPLDDDYVSLDGGRKAMHRPCMVRVVTGSEDCIRRGPHQPGTCQPDDPALSKREAALRAYTAWTEIHGRWPGEEEWPEVING